MMVVCLSGTPRSLVSTPFYITYFFERIHLKEPISVRVRWDAAEKSDESEDDNYKNRFFNIIIQQ
jgi:hypothetical protein